MKRYSKTSVTVDKSGIRAYTTTYYPPVPISDTDRFVYVREGDRVDTLAYKYYKDPQYLLLLLYNPLHSYK